MARWNSCIVLDPGPEEKSAWQFNAASKKFPLQKSESRPKTEPLPKTLVDKDWHTLFQPKLNIAWIPPDKLFLRAIQLPKSNSDELQSMIDIQLEKLSPLPPTQIVWTFEILPEIIDGLQTVIVVMVSRDYVQGLLGELETEGYLADRLEAPILDQLAATKVYEDGVWLYPVIGSSRSTCLAAWHYGGILRNLSLLPIPPGSDVTNLIQAHLTQVSWAGEIEGWLNAPPRIHLVAPPELAVTWENAFTEDQPVVVIPPLPLTDLASRTGLRAISHQNRINLLPPEYAARYKQRLVDKVWMRALGAMAALYVLGAAAYIGWAQLVRWQKTGVDAEITAISQQYTNALKLKAEVAILKDQLALQYAALDSWKAITDTIPPSLTLEKIDFSKGKLTISGSGDQNISDFETRLRQAPDLNDQIVFAEVNLKNQMTLPNGKTSWIINTTTARGVTP